MSMIVQKERLIELLHHNDARVRHCGVEALAQFFPQSEGVISHLLQGIRAYPEHCLALAYPLKSFIPNDKDICDLINLYHETAGAKEKNSLNLYFHIVKSFSAFPFEIIEKHHELFEANPELKKSYEILRRREEVRCRLPEELWDELEALCEEYTGEKVDDEAYRYAQLLAEGLARYPEQVREKVIDLLNEANPDNYLMEEYLVPLAGTLKIEETIPALFRIFAESDFMYFIHDNSRRALGKIGTPQVLEGIEQHYSNVELRPALSEILGWMPYEYTEDFAIPLLEREQDPEIKTFIAGSLCSIFSLKATDLIKQIIEARQYDPTITSLTDELIPVYVYHKQNIDCSHLERIDKEFSDKMFRKSPFYKISRQLHQSFENQTELQAQEGKQSQEIHVLDKEEKKSVPQKKGKAALKRARKRKKKKRK